LFYFLLPTGREDGKGKSYMRTLTVTSDEEGRRRAIISTSNYFLRTYGFTLGKDGKIFIKHKQ
jgi:hypothetical protein